MIEPYKARWLGVPVIVVAGGGERAVVALDIRSRQIGASHPAQAMRSTVWGDDLTWVCAEVPADEVIAAV